VTGNYESWLKAEIEFRKRAVLNKIDEVERITSDLRQRIESDGYVSDIGELQSSGVMLDTAVVAYATQRQSLINYQQMEKGDL